MGRQLDIALTSHGPERLLAAASDGRRESSGGAERARPGEFHRRGYGQPERSAYRRAISAVDRFSVEGTRSSIRCRRTWASSRRRRSRNGSLTRAACERLSTRRSGYATGAPTPTSSSPRTSALRNGDLADSWRSPVKPAAGYCGSTHRRRAHHRHGRQSAGQRVDSGGERHLDGEPFDQLQARVNLADQLVTIPAAFMTSGAVTRRSQRRIPASARQLHDRADPCARTEQPVDLAKRPAAAAAAAEHRRHVQLNAD